MELPRIFRRSTDAGINLRILSSKTVAIFGVGGIGSILAEILVRLGIGKLILVDKDIVEEENLNRLGFYPEDLGRPKVEVLRERLESFDKVMAPYKVTIETFHDNVFAMGKRIEEIIRNSDCILTAFDNLDARLEVNSLALRYKKVLIDGGASTDGRRGRITVVKPFKSPCLGCYYGADTLINQDLVEEVPCSVSLPTTMLMIASIQAHLCMEYLHSGDDALPDLILINMSDMSIVSYSGLSRRPSCPFCSR